MPWLARLRRLPNKLNIQLCAYFQLKYSYTCVIICDYPKLPLAPHEHAACPAVHGCQLTAGFRLTFAQGCLGTQTRRRTWRMSSRGEWRETKWVCTTHLEPAQSASRLRRRNPTGSPAPSLERALDVAKSTGDFASVHGRFQPTSQFFFSARTGLRPEDLTRCAHVASTSCTRWTGTSARRRVEAPWRPRVDGNSREERLGFRWTGGRCTAPQGVPGRR